MSNKDEKAAKPKKGKGLIVKLALGLVLIGAGGGGAIALVKTGVLGGGDHAEHPKEPDLPKLIRKGQVDPYAPTAGEGEHGGGATAEVEGEGGSEYRTAYFTFSDEFTSNLKGSDSLIQVSLACSTRRDGRVLIWLKKHELAIRSAMLQVLADTPVEDVDTIEGKNRLQKRLTAAINQVLEKTEGFGGVDAVYFRSFLVQ
jgi:flagellar FliL protein